MQTDLNDVLAFTRVADSGSFTRAAALLGWPKSSVSHRVARLERLLGARLIERSTRRVRLTEVGARYHEHARRVLLELEQASGTIAQFRSRPQGALQVTASVVLGQALLPALVSRFTVAHPDVRLRIELSNRRVDLIEEGFDLAIRAGTLESSTLVSRHLGHAASRLYAAPAYLRARGTPGEPADLMAHDLIDCSPVAVPEPWRMSRDDGRETTVAKPYLLGGNDPSLMRDVAASGLGIVTLPAFIAAPLLATGDLLPVLPAWASRRMAVQAVFPSNKGLSPAVRAFVDMAVEHLGDSLEQGEPPRAKPRSSR